MTGLSGTDAVLAAAAAATRLELHRAFMAAIESNDLLADLGRPLVGDGAAGRHLLGGMVGGTSGGAPRVGRRCRNVAERQGVVWSSTVGDFDEPLIPAEDDLCPGSDVGLEHLVTLDRYREKCTVCGRRIAP